MTPAYLELAQQWAKDGVPFDRSTVAFVPTVLTDLLDQRDRLFQTIAELVDFLPASQVAHPVGPGLIVGSKADETRSGSSPDVATGCDDCGASLVHVAGPGDYRATWCSVCDADALELDADNQEPDLSTVLPWWDDVSEFDEPHKFYAAPSPA